MPNPGSSPPDATTRRVMEATSAKEVLQTLGDPLAGKALSLQAVSAALVQLAKLQDTFTAALIKDPYMHLLISLGSSRLQSVLKRESTGSSGDCSNMLWAVAKLDHRMRPQLAKLKSDAILATRATARQMGSEEIANVIWASASLQLDSADSDDILTSAAQRLPRVASRLTPDGISRIFWAIASMDARATKCFSDDMSLLAKTALCLLPRMDAEGVSNIIWSCAVLKHHELLEQLQAVSDAILPLSGDMNSQQIANIMWSAAELRADASPNLVAALPGLLQAFGAIAPEEVRAKDISVASRT